MISSTTRNQRPSKQHSRSHRLQAVSRYKGTALADTTVVSLSCHPIPSDACGSGPPRADGSVFLVSSSDQAILGRLHMSNEGRFIGATTYCGKAIWLAPPQLMPLPYKKEAGRTVEHTACNGIKLQCCSDLKTQHEPSSRFTIHSTNPWMSASTRSASAMEDAALSINLRCFNAFGGPLKSLILAGSVLR